MAHLWHLGLGCVHHGETLGLKAWRCGVALLALGYQRYGGQSNRLQYLLEAGFLEIGSCERGLH